MDAGTNRSVGTVLGMLATVVGLAALICLLYALQVDQPTWWLVGLTSALMASALVRTPLAGADAPAVEAGDAAPPPRLASDPIRVVEGLVGPLATLGGIWGLFAPVSFQDASPPPALWGVAAVAGLAALGAGQYASTTPGLRGGDALAQLGRFTTWAVGLVALEVLVVSTGWPLTGVIRGLSHIGGALVLVIGVQTLADTWRGRRRPAGRSAVLRWFFSRWNPVASLGDALQAGLGVDLRTTWAVQFLRSAFGPMAFAVALAGWLCTSLVRVGPEEVAIHERLGEPLSRDAVGPGLHLVAPWPIDRLRRVPAQRVLTMSIGEAEEEEEEEHEGPEDTLWARMHAEEEYTLLLGDGHDLVTIDGLLHYRVSDPYTYLYGAQNPEEGLRAAAYEALTRRTVGRSLDGVLSQNLSVFAEEVVAEIAERARALDLGVMPVSFTLKGLHPPFAVAGDYQAVVSARIARETSVLRAEAYRSERLPEARSDARAEVDEAMATQATSRAEAVGEAEAFRSLVDRYEAEPELFRFRRRMEVLESQLRGRDLTIIDRRFEAQGGQLWITK